MSSCIFWQLSPYTLVFAMAVKNGMKSRMVSSPNYSVFIFYSPTVGNRAMDIITMWNKPFYSLLNKVQHAIITGHFIRQFIGTCLLSSFQMPIASNGLWGTCRQFYVTRYIVEELMLYYFHLIFFCQIWCWGCCFTFLTHGQ